MKLLPSPTSITMIIRVRYSGQNLYSATTPNQGHYRSNQCEQGFDRAAEVLLDRHYPGHNSRPVQIKASDERVQALGLQLSRYDADIKETRWYVATVEVAPAPAPTPAPALTPKRIATADTTPTFAL